MARQPNKYFGFSMTDYLNTQTEKLNRDEHCVDNDCIVNNVIQPYTFYSKDEQTCKAYCAKWSDGKFLGLGYIYQVGLTKLRQLS